MSDAVWKTAISSVSRDKIRIKGYDIGEIMEKLSYAEVVYLVLKGELPSTAEADLMNAILVSCVDHGPTPPSVLSTRTIVSGGNSLNAALAGGVLVIGDAHGGAIEESARILQEFVSTNSGQAADAIAGSVLAWLEREKLRMPGFGHLLHQTDPRSVKLFDLAARHNCSGEHVALCQALEQALEDKLGRRLPINIDGAIAAVLSDMGFDWRLGKGFFVISRMPGLLAHAYEEMTREKPLRVLGPLPYEYDGPDDRDL